ncbi:MAG: hypothetical protein WCC74_01175 [Minisyncoccia bacterium]
MKKEIIATAIVAFILGILISVTVYFGYVVYKMNAKIDQNTKNITMITDFINGSLSGQNIAPATTTRKK